MIKVCPVSGTEKEEKIKRYKTEEEEYNQKGIYPFSKYAAHYYPDVCCGNCEICSKWEECTEKELYIKDNDTFLNHLKYETGFFLANFLFASPFTLPVGYAFFGEFHYGFALSLAVAMTYALMNMLNGVYPQTFEEWLGERFEKQKGEDS